ncbi:MAG: DMT family transporter, partial [Actinobacteria bacterium]|nr:DMT family transporter [Actinomycetota bacterium]
MATEATSKRTRDLGILALVVLGPVWGYGWVATKVALDFSDALTFAALRVPLSAALLFLAMLVARRPLRPPPLGWTMLVGLLQTTLFMGLVLTALHDTGAGRVSVLTYTMPFWLLLLAWTFLGERLRGAQWLAVTLAFTGLVLVVRPWAFDGVVSGVLTVLGGASWAASALVVKLLQRRHTVDVLSLTAWQMLLGSV